jgi:hypothetical protein
MTGALPDPAIIAAIKSAGVRFVMALPDIVSSAGLPHPISRYSRAASPRPRVLGAYVSFDRLGT